MSKKYIFISPFFYPEPISTGKYNSMVVERMVKNGGSVEVVCSHPIYPEWKVSISDSEMDGVKIRRGGEFVRYPNNALLRRAVLELWFLFHVLRSLLSIGKFYGEFIAVFPPSLFMLCASALAPKNAKFTGIVHDLQGVYAGRKKGLAFGIVSKLIFAIEGKVFRRCDSLIFLSETMLNSAVSAYSLDRSKAKVFYPFITLDNTDPSLGLELDSYFIPGLKSLVYSGAMGEKQAPEQLIDFFISVLDSYPDWEALVFSQGPIFDGLKARFNHSRLKFFPLVSPDLLRPLLLRSDIQVVPQAPGTSEGSLPSKMPNIIAAGTRMLCITDPGSELELLVQQYSAGVVSTSWDKPMLMQKFTEVTVLSRATSVQSGKLLEKFSLDALVEDLLINTEVSQT